MRRIDTKEAKETAGRLATAVSGMVAGAAKGSARTIRHDLMEQLEERAKARAKARARAARARPNAKPKPKVRVVKVKRTRIRTVLKAAGLGAAIMYFFDPDRGNARRARIRDQARAMGRRTVRQGERVTRQVQSQAYAAYQQATHPIPEHPPTDDETLKDVVETELFGRPDVQKGKIVVNVEDGVVVLRGEVDAPALMVELPRAAMAIVGVAGVQNLLHLPGEPAPNKEEAQEASAMAERQQTEEAQRDQRPA
jgi:osmotically-inducible protein OsmY